MKRNIKFWTQYTWESMEVFLVTAVVLAIIALFGTEGMDWGYFASVIPYFLCLGAIFGMLMINSGSHSLYVPLLISLGETRRNVFLGFHYYRTLIIAVTISLCTLIWLLVPGDVSAAGLQNLPTLLCVLVIAASVGSILGTIFVKWKWAGTILIVILCGGFGGMVGASGAAIANGLQLADMLGLVVYLADTPWWLFCIAAVLFALDLLFQWMILRRQEVKL